MKNNSVIIANYIRSPVKWRTKSEARERSGGWGGWRESGRKRKTKRETESRKGGEKKESKHWWCGSLIPMPSGDLHPHTLDSMGHPVNS